PPASPVGPAPGGDRSRHLRLRPGRRLRRRSARGLVLARLRLPGRAARRFLPAGDPGAGPRRRCRRGRRLRRRRAGSATGAPRPRRARQPRAVPLPLRLARRRPPPARALTRRRTPVLPSARMKLIVQIPCLNEEGTLPETLRAIPRTIPGVD